MRKGAETRERILAIAEVSVLAKGFGATSIEEIIAEAGITKSGFFYHFRDKNALARALIIRYDEEHRAIFESVFGRAALLADGDPLQSLLIGLKLLAETMADLPNGHPGCLMASLVYQERLFDREVVALMAETMRHWNEFLMQLIAAAAKRYGGVEESEWMPLARMIYSAVDGGIVQSRALNDPSILPEQILVARNHLKHRFEAALEARRAA